MKTFLKILAILALLATVAGAGAVLYGVRNLAPQAELNGTARVSALENEDRYNSLRYDLEHGCFAGEAQTDSLPDAADCVFEAYTVRLTNSGFLPQEWVALSADVQEGDLLTVPEEGAYVLNPSTQGDMTLILLRRADAPQAARTITVSCRVLGRELTTQLSVPEGTD